MAGGRLPVSARLCGLLEVAELVRAGHDLPVLLAGLGQAVAKALGFRTVTLDLYHPAWDDFRVEAVHGDEQDRERLLGRRRAWHEWRSLLAESRVRRGVYLLSPCERAGGSVLVPLTGSEGTLLGIISAAGTESGWDPSDEELDVLVAIAAHATLAIEAALERQERARHRAALEQLRQISSRLAERRVVADVLELVCDGISRQLGFEKVSIELVDPESGALARYATRGWEPAAHPARNVRGEVQRLLDPAFEREGCFLLPMHEVEARLGPGRSTPVSARNGRGPHAWSRHLLLVPLYDRDGELLGVIWVDDPIDRLIPSRERLQALRLFANEAAAALEATDRFEALHASQELYRSVVENSMDLISVLDLDGNVVYASPSHTAVLGYSHDELVAQATLALVHPEDAGEVAAAFEAAVSGRAPATVVARVLHKNGRWLVLEGAVSALRNADGSVEMLLATSRDITSRLDAAEDRERLESELRQAQKMEAIGRLAGGIAHDFNNLLTTINGYAELLAAVVEDEEHRRDLVEIRRAGERAAALTSRLLTFSRKQVLEPRPVSLNAVVEVMDTLLRRLIGEDIELATALDPALAPVVADPGQLEQVILNLAVNSRDAMPAGGRLTLATSNVEVNGNGPVAAGRYVMLAVTDTGCGIDLETQARIFEPFFTTKEPGRGTGLGLSTVHDIAEQAGGAVVVDSEPGRGASFRVYLSQAAGTEEVTESDHRDGAAGGGERILLVEDDEMVRVLTRRILEGSGYTVVDAPDGEQALELARANADSLDLVITDVVMPRMSGRELVDRVAELRPGLAALYISGYSDDSVATLGVADGSVMFLQKPYSSSRLTRKVREALDSARS